MIAFVVGAICLTLMEYWGSSYELVMIVEKIAEGASTSVVKFTDALEQSPFYRLMQFGWWSVVRVTGYLIIPALVVKLIFREKLRDHGLETKGMRDHLWIYGVCYCFVLILVIVASFRRDFTNYYPFYKLAYRSWFDLLVWELLYAAQFFSLEFFFRGFWLKACKNSLGSHAIFAMVVPYCMIHFGKPWMEVLAAIVAGIVLGTLALKTRSIWSGFLIHVSVALSMDMAALFRTGGLPSGFWPG